MIIILDVNILLSAMIKDSRTRKIILTSEQEFYFPEKSLEKIRKYKDYIQKKSGLSDSDFMSLFNALMMSIKIIPNEELLDNWDKAKTIMESIDPEDIAFIAAALSKEDSIIWSDDKHFDKQKIINAFKTKELINLFENIKE